MVRPAAFTVRGGLGTPNVGVLADENVRLWAHVIAGGPVQRPQVRRGDLLRFETCGGGGWGDPLTRDPMRVRQDVARGFVSVRGARDDYGVVLEPATLEIDKQATDDERAGRAGERPLIDRGPGFAEAEALWRASRNRSAS